MPRALFFVLLLSVGWSTVHCQSCICTRTGISNGVETGKPGCVLKQSAKTPTCFVESSVGCEAARPSTEFSGASFVNCPVEEALFYAAEADDVESIMRFREMGISLRVWRDLDTAVFENKTSPLLFHAAAYGSFGVVEDMIINRDFDCKERYSPRTVLCELSGAAHCAENDLRRTTINIFIDRGFDEGCVYHVARSPVLADREEHPYFVSVRSAYSGGYAHRCGGVLVAKEAVLTAAHCVDGSQGSFDPILLIEPNYLWLDGGDYQEEAVTEIRKATKIVLHPKWLKGNYTTSVENGNDVALLKLNQPSDKTPISISSSQNLTIGEGLRFLGMGRQSTNGLFAFNLRIQRIEAADPHICQMEYPQGIASNILCVGGMDADFCTGDDGGPLMRRLSNSDELVGIAHLKHPSHPCGTRGIPGIYSNAAKLRKWIRRTMKRHF